MSNTIVDDSSSPHLALKKAAPRKEQAAPKEVYPAHPAFEDAANDVVIRLPSGHCFRFRRLYLEGASSVFEDMARIGGSSKRTRQGLDIIDLDEFCPAFQKFLLFVHPREPDPKLNNASEAESYAPEPLRAAVLRLPLTPSLKTRLLILADKYQAPGVLATVLSKCKDHCRQDAPSVLALGLIYGSADTIRTALKYFSGGWGVTSTGQSRSKPNFERPRFTLADVPPNLYLRIPRETWFRLQPYQLAMFDRDKTSLNHGCAYFSSLLSKVCRQAGGPQGSSRLIDGCRPFRRSPVSSRSSRRRSTQLSPFRRRSNS